METAGETPKPANAAGQRVRSVGPVGTTAVLAELSGLQDVLALQALLLEQPLPGQVDVLAAAETVMVKADSPGRRPPHGAQLLRDGPHAPVPRAKASWCTSTPCTTARTSPK